jgi:ferritin-like metal-binding protein YciE
MASLDSLDALLEDELRDIYDAEKRISKALPKIMKKATSRELKQALGEHLQQTAQHVERLEQAFGQLDLKVKGKKCIGMKNLLEEGVQMMREADDKDTRDALIIAAAQKVEHYEIATYGTLRTWASLLGQEQVAALFEETLAEEKQTDQLLTSIAESSVNQEAADTSDGADGGARQVVTGARGRQTNGGAARNRGGKTTATTRSRAR